MNKRKPQATRTHLAKARFGWKFKDAAPYLVGVVGLSVALGIFASIPSGKTDTSQILETASEEFNQAQLELNLASGQPLNDPEDGVEEPTKYTVRSGDNMAILFRRAGLGPTDVHKLAYESEHGEQFANLRPGNHFEFTLDTENEATRIDYVLSPLERYIAVRTENGFETSHELIEPDLIPTMSVGSIESSFYLAGSKAGLTDALIMELSNIFGWDIDFIMDIREGDQFSVLYEEQYLDGEKLGNGDILAAEFINRGKSHKAVRYEDIDGKIAFYTPEGESMRKAFLRTPLDVFRISSHFSLNRKHPVLNTIRAHKGVDYAAARGTPIKATGSGRVTYASTQGGYGNVIKIQHAQSYKTVYAHMDRFGKGINVGKMVEQGDTIGYVGSTGLATGPHLHYEFYVNGVVRNPITVDLPDGTPVPGGEMERFKAFTNQYISLLDNANTQYAGTPAETSPGS